jgi:hypothetical protein
VIGSNDINVVAARCCECRDCKAGRISYFVVDPSEVASHFSRLDPQAFTGHRSRCMGAQKLMSKSPALTRLCAGWLCLSRLRETYALRLVVTWTFARSQRKLGRQAPATS